MVVFSNLTGETSYRIFIYSQEQSMTVSHKETPSVGRRSTTSDCANQNIERAAENLWTGGIQGGAIEVGTALFIWPYH